MTLKNEGDLASVDGMNVFASFVVLQDFLDLTPEMRLKEFGPLIGVYRVVSSILSTEETKNHAFDTYSRLC
jgi:hypothetical protein